MQISDLPKIELHHHLDGALRPLSLYNEARRRDLPQAELEKEEFKSRLKVPHDNNSLTDFLAVFNFFYDIAADADFLRKAAAELCEDLVAENIIYCETRFAPHLFSNKKTSTEDIILSVIEGLEHGMSDTGANVKLILSLMRGMDVSSLKELIELAEKYHERGIAGIDLAGDESKYDGSEYADLFAAASENGMNITVHAGEAAGASSVRTAVEQFRARRIGHGIRSIEDESLIEKLAEEKIHLEVCLTSNLHTGAVESLDKHPLPLLKNAGVSVSINTDDPSVSDISLSHEWALAFDTYHFTAADAEKILSDTALAAFCDDKVKESLKGEINSYFRNLSQ